MLLIMQTPEPHCSHTESMYSGGDSGICTPAITPGDFGEKKHFTISISTHLLVLRALVYLSSYSGFGFVLSFLLLQSF
jgi:hypothetical protein